LDNNQLGLQDVLNMVLDKTIKKKKQKGYYGEIQNMVNYSVLNHIMAMGGSSNALPQVTADS